MTVALMRRWPVALATVRNQVAHTWRLLVAMPDPAIRSLAVGLAGLTTGLYVGGAPRLLKVGSLGPTLVVGALALFRRDHEVALAT